MIPFLLILSVLCMSGYFIVYSMSPPDRATVAGTRGQDEAAFLAAERCRFDELVADLDLRTAERDRLRHDSADRHSVNTITSDALDALYAERDLLREQLATPPGRQRHRRPVPRRRRRRRRAAGRAGLRPHDPKRSPVITARLRRPSTRCGRPVADRPQGPGVR